MYYSMKSSNQLLEKLQSELGHTWEAPLIVSGNYTGIVGPLSYFFRNLSLPCYFSDFYIEFHTLFIYLLDRYLHMKVQLVFIVFLLSPVNNIIHNYKELILKNYERQIKK